MRPGLPITLVNMADSLCVVVGGGEVAERKVHSLLDAGARVRVIAPMLTDELAALARERKIGWSPRAYQSGDLAEAFLAIAATDDAPVNHAAAREAMERGLLVNVVDDPDFCNFIAPAVVRRGGLTIAVSTGGDAPALAAHLRAQLEEQFGQEWGTYLEWLLAIREQISRRYPELDGRRRAWARLLDSDLRTLVATHSEEEIRARIAQLLE